MRMVLVPAELVDPLVAPPRHLVTRGRGGLIGLQSPSVRPRRVTDGPDRGAAVASAL